MLCKLIRIRENNKRTVEQMFNLEDYKLKSIIVSSPFQTLAFLLASLLLSQTSPHAAICGISTVKKAELAPLQKKADHSYSGGSDSQSQHRKKS